MTDRRTHRRVDVPPHPDCDCRHCDEKRVARNTITFDIDARTATVGGVMLHNVHSHTDCLVRPCTIHHPTNHHMRSWPLHWRDDRKLVERICPHGVGHYDPDQIPYWQETGREYMAIHGCCGSACCRAPTYCLGCGIPHGQDHRCGRIT